MASHNELGKWGEDVAAAYLQHKGYRIITRNWRIDHLEIDIIATDGRMLVFVEVKTRRNDRYGNPYEAVDWRKQRHLMTAMRRYIGLYRIDAPVRFDILSVTGTPRYYQIEHIENGVSNF